jgi:DNA polymerase
VVVKTLSDEDLERGIDVVFAEAQALRQLDHPAIIRLQDCGFGAPSGDARPYLVMDYFEGTTLEDAARQAPLSVPELLEVATAIASALRAAHGQEILHRDIKPANVLVRRPEASGGPASGRRWEVKVIDFGLALRKTGRESQLASTRTIAGSSIAGTLEYGAPEQMGKLTGVPVGPPTDVYAFGKTCCYALFRTAQPLLKHWRSIPAELAELLESCLEEDPRQRPQDFGVILERLTALAAPAQPAPQVPAPAPAAALTAPAPVEEPQRRHALTLLTQQVRQCTRCTPLARTRRQTVFGVGPLDAPIFFIGEAPGADEDSTGEPFVGAAGRVLNELLGAVGLRRDQVYISNAIKCRTPGNRKPEPGEMSNCREYLTQQIELVKPRSLCLLGSSAVQGVLGTTESLGRLRGRLRDFHGLPVLCTYHPAFLLPHRAPEKRGDVLEDLRLLLRRLGLPTRS